MNRLLFGSYLVAPSSLLYWLHLRLSSPNSLLVDFRLCSLLLPVSATLVTIRYSMCSLSSRLAKCLKFYSLILTYYLDIYELNLNWRGYGDSNPRSGDRQSAILDLGMIASLFILFEILFNQIIIVVIEAT